MKRKILATVSAVALLASLTPVSAFALEAAPSLGGVISSPSIDINGDGKPDVDPVANPFPDVSEEDWFYDDVQFVRTNALMNGIPHDDGDIYFEPETTTTRAMVATILYRMTGEPEITAENSFSDVEEDAWYTDAVVWASENEIVLGYADSDLFGTNDSITREQMATMIYRYAQYDGKDVATDASLEGFEDIEDVQDWATDAFTWAAANKVIGGKPTAEGTTILDPAGNATRSEIAAILHRYASLHECDHISQTAKDNGDGTHTFFGNDCGKELETEDHTYEAGVTSNNNGTHNVNCSCGNSVEIKCLDPDGDGKCDSCGYLMYCNHTSQTAKDNGDGTHTFFCNDCGKELETEDHTYEAGVTSNNDGTHNVNCSCGDFVTYKCYDYDGDHACDSCGYKMGCLFGAGVTSNNDGTHNVNCSCGNYMTVKCLDPDGDGKCDSCGYLMYCNHISKSVKNNKNGTHTFFCRDCGEKLETEEHEYNEATGACVCGALKS